MPKALLTEQKLIAAINVALAHDWPHKDRPCRVEALRKVKLPDRNWVVDTYSTSGPNLAHVQDCEELSQRVLDELFPIYDVLWNK